MGSRVWLSSLPKVRRRLGFKSHYLNFQSWSSNMFRHLLHNPWKIKFVVFQICFGDSSILGQAGWHITQIENYKCFNRILCYGCLNCITSINILHFINFIKHTFYKYTSKYAWKVSWQPQYIRDDVSSR